LDAQVIPPSDWIDFTPPSANRLAALAALRGPEITRAQHMAMGFPYEFGQATPQGAAAMAPDPALHFMYTNYALAIDPHQISFSQAAKELLSGTRYSDDRFINPDEERLASPREQAMVQRQVNTLEALLRFMAPGFGAKDSLYADFDFENAMIKPDDVRAKPWHTDNRANWQKDNKGKSLQAAKSAENFPTPGLVAQIRSYGPAEFLQNEWHWKGGKLVLRPAAKAMLDAQEELDSAILDGVTAAKQSRLQARVDRLTNKARRKGLVIDAQPYGFMLISTQSPHRSYRPKKRLFRPIKPVASSHMRLLVMRNIPASAP
jgi:hypothetical protein